MENSSFENNRIQPKTNQDQGPRENNKRPFRSPVAISPSPLDAISMPMTLEDTRAFKQLPLFDMGNDVLRMAPVPTQKGVEPIIHKSLDASTVTKGLAHVFGRMVTRVSSFSKLDLVKNGLNRTKAISVIKGLVRDGEVENIVPALGDSLYKTIMTVKEAVPFFDNYKQEINLGPTSHEKHTAIFIDHVNTGMFNTAKEVDITTPFEIDRESEFGKLATTLLSAVGDALAAKRTVSHYQERIQQGGKTPTQYDMFKTYEYMTIMSKIGNYEKTSDNGFIQACSVRPDFLALKPIGTVTEEERNEALQLVASYNSVMESIGVGAYLRPNQMTEGQYGIMKDVVQNLGKLITLDFIEAKTTLTESSNINYLHAKTLAENNVNETMQTGVLMLFNLYKFSDHSLSVLDFIRKVIDDGGIEPKILVAITPIFKRGQQISEVTESQVRDAKPYAKLFDMNNLRPGEKLSDLAEVPIERLERNILGVQKARIIVEMMKARYKRMNEHDPVKAEEYLNRYKSRLEKYSIEQLTTMLRKSVKKVRLTGVPDNAFVIPVYDDKGQSMIPLFPDLDTNPVLEGQHPLFRVSETKDYYGTTRIEFEYGPLED